MNDYKSLRCFGDETNREIIIAHLSEFGFEAFVELDNGLEAFIKKEEFNPNQWNEIQLLLKEFSFSFEWQDIEAKNWNEEWEKNFEPIIVDEDTRIRAPFHASDHTFVNEIIIQPKNTFGTGHHETTCLMLRLMKQMTFENKLVLDYGTGTGILAIQAARKNAAFIHAIDIDPWCMDNVQENMNFNQVSNIEVRCCNLESFSASDKFNIVLANINRNILMDSFSTLSDLMKTEASIIISGFYENDERILSEELNKYGFQKQAQMTQNNWCACVYARPN